MPISPKRERKEDLTQSNEKMAEPKKASNIKYIASKKSSKRIENVIEMLHYKVYDIVCVCVCVQLLYRSSHI